MHIVYICEMTYVLICLQENPWSCIAISLHTLARVLKYQLARARLTPTMVNKTK